VPSQSKKWFQTIDWYQESSPKRLEGDIEKRWLARRCGRGVSLLGEMRVRFGPAPESPACFGALGSCYSHEDTLLVEDSLRFGFVMRGRDEWENM
jgi:hypothetical protein